MGQVSLYGTGSYNPKNPRNPLFFFVFLVFRVFVFVFLVLTLVFLFVLFALFFILVFTRGTVRDGAGLKFARSPRSFFVLNVSIVFTSKE